MKASLTLRELNSSAVTAVLPPFLCPPPYEGLKPYRDPSVCSSLRWQRGAAAWAVGTPATRDVRTADPPADGCRSAASRTVVGGGGGISSRRPRGDNLYVSARHADCLCFSVVRLCVRAEASPTGLPCTSGFAFH